MTNDKTVEAINNVSRRLEKIELLLHEALKRMSLREDERFIEATFEARARRRVYDVIKAYEDSGQKSMRIGDANYFGAIKWEYLNEQIPELTTSEVNKAIDQLRHLGVIENDYTTSSLLGESYSIIRPFEDAEKDWEGYIPQSY